MGYEQRPAPHPARYYRRVESDAVRCELCPHFCVIAHGQVGRCGIRSNRRGILYADRYGMTTGVALDPIEKKPLFRFHPGEYIVSLGTTGCNFTCDFCQNWPTAQNPAAATISTNPQELVLRALQTGACGVAYTYNEPFIWFEFILACCRALREQGLANVLVTNGFVNPEPLRELLPYIDAMNIDIKSMDEEFYRRYCGGRLEPVLQTVRTGAAAVHVELTNLVIPGCNDREEHFTALRDWIYEYTGADTPLHLSRYFPANRMRIPATPRTTLEQAADICRKKLRYVFPGNISGDRESE